MEQDDVTGAKVYDVDGDEVGRVEQAYSDDSGAVRFVRVKLGTLLAKHRLVPVDGAQRTDGALRVPYSKDVIENAPELSDDVNPLSGMIAEDLRGYYGSGADTAAASEDNRTAARPVQSSADSAPAERSTTTAEAAARSPEIGGTAAVAESGGQIGQVRDLGDVVEIPVTEERLVKQPVVTEVVRVRKNSVSDTQVISADLRKEDVEVESEGDARVRENDDEA